MSCNEFCSGGTKSVEKYISNFASILKVKYVLHRAPIVEKFRVAKRHYVENLYTIYIYMVYK
jgi:hypothetical protein